MEPQRTIFLVSQMGRCDIYIVAAMMKDRYGPNQIENPLYLVDIVYNISVQDLQHRQPWPRLSPPGTTGSLP